MIYITTIAFNNPLFIQLQIKSFKLYILDKNYKFLVFDDNEFLDVAVVDLEDLENIFFDGKIRNPDGAYMALHHLGLLKIRF
jgi:hypothetical protein